MVNARLPNGYRVNAVIPPIALDGPTTRLPNGYRVNAVIPPIALDGPTMTIRKFSDRISALGHLVRLGSMPAWYAELLSLAVRLRQDLAIAGGTGSGKTTLLNALSCEIPHGEPPTALARWAIWSGWGRCPPGTRSCCPLRCA